MNAVSFLAKVLWILWLALALRQGAWALDGCRAADVSDDGVVDQADVDIVISLLGSASPRVDLDGDGAVSDADLAIVSGFSGTTCPTCAADLSANGNVCAEDRLILEDAYGLDCRPDLNRDGQVDGLDVALLEAYAGSALSLAAERADLNDDAVVDDGDLILLEESFGRDCRPDFNRDGTVDARDLGPLHAAWGACPGTSPDSRGDPEPTCDEGEGSPLPPSDL